MIRPNPSSTEPSWLERFLSSGYFLFYPILLASILTLLTPVSFWLLPEMLEGLFDLTPSGVVWVTLLAFHASWVAMVTARLVLIYAAQRFNVKLLGNSSEITWWEVGLSAIPGFSIAIGALQPWSGFSPDKLFAAILGFTVAFVFLFLAALGQYLLSTPPQDLSTSKAHFVLPLNGLFDRARKWKPWFSLQMIEKWVVVIVPKSIGYGYIDYARGEILPGHLFAFLLLLLTFAVYLFLYFIHGRLAVPALAYFLLFLILLGWTASAAAFFLDRYRVSTLFVLILISAWANSSPTSDHFYPIVEQNARCTPKQDGDLTPEKIIRKWKVNPSSQDSPGIIVVAANGGGIQSAAWTAKVLTGLEEEFPGQFGKSIRLISSVSGGTVGAMYFVDAFTQNHALPSDTEELRRIVRKAEESSLSETAWGLAYPDFWRMFLPWFVPKYQDRGWAMEQAWKRGMIGQEETLFSWRCGVEEGWRPATIFNATIGESGEPLLLSTFQMPSAARAKNFDDLYTHRDIQLTTAARLSATFPYVTPMSRAVFKDNWNDPSVHIADGGYFDNYGMVTLIRWLEAALPIYQTEFPGKRVLVIEIRDSLTKEQSAPKTNQGFLYAALGPLLTMLHVRNSGQISRNDRELERLIDLSLQKKPEVKIIPVRLWFEGKDAPLSWHLTGKQRMR